MTASPGYALQALRKVRQVICRHCGATFAARDSRATYCSNRCRQAAKYQRIKAKK